MESKKKQIVVRENEIIALYPENLVDENSLVFCPPEKGAIYVTNMDGKLAFVDANQFLEQIKEKQVVVQEAKTVPEEYEEWIRQYKECYEILDSLANADTYLVTGIAYKSHLSAYYFFLSVQQDNNCLIEGPSFRVDEIHYEGVLYLFSVLLNYFLLYNKPTNGSIKKNDYMDESTNIWLASRKKATFLGKPQYQNKHLFQWTYSSLFPELRGKIFRAYTMDQREIALSMIEEEYKEKFINASMELSDKEKQEKTNSDRRYQYIKSIKKEQ